MRTNRRGRSGRRDGFTLIELLVSFSALLVVLLGFSRMLLSSHMASSTSHEATLAKEAARAMVEELQSASLAEVYARYNANAGDDPGAGTSPGAGFAVPGLDAPPDDADGLPGRILFPEQGGTLSELVVQPQYGWPMDMDRDGSVLSADVSGSYRLLPVVVRVEWRGVGNEGIVEFKSVLGGL